MRREFGPIGARAEFVGLMMGKVITQNVVVCFYDFSWKGYIVSRKLTGAG